MAVKIYISGNALRAENTSISLSLLDVPKASVYFFNQALNNGSVKIGYLPLDNDAQPLLNIALTDAVDENLVAFTAETFRLFCDANLGYSGDGSGFIRIDSGTGWAQYKDTVYTAASTFAITAGAGFTALPNNKGVVIESYLPQGVTTFYNGTVITPENEGDYYIFTLRMNAKCAHANGIFEFGIDIGGAQGIIFKETLLFSKGAGVEHAFSIDANGFTGTTFLANGGTIKISPIVGNITIYDIEYQITRTYKS